jgi:branched-chain amino acid transport system ATP-binding protein
VPEMGKQVVDYVKRQDPLLELRDVQVVYNRVAIAIDGISIQVPSGSIVAVLGPNGAGKTTIIRSISGFPLADVAEVSAGQVLLRGEPITRLAPHQVSRAGVAIVPERDKVFVSLTVERNMRLAQRPGAGKPAQRQWQDLVAELFPVLTTRRKQVAGYLSGGERQMLAFACAMLSCPDLLLIDELSLGLAPMIVSRLADTVKQANQEMGLTVLLVEQFATAALALASYAYVLDTGRIVIEGTAEALSERADVRDLYFGIGSRGDHPHRGDPGGAAGYER